MIWGEVYDSYYSETDKYNTQLYFKNYTKDGLWYYHKKMLYNGQKLNVWSLYLCKFVYKTKTFLTNKLLSQYECRKFNKFTLSQGFPFVYSPVWIYNALRLIITKCAKIKCIIKQCTNMYVLRKINKNCSFQLSWISKKNVSYIQVDTYLGKNFQQEWFLLFCSKLLRLKILISR